MTFMVGARGTLLYCFIRDEDNILVAGGDETSVDGRWTYLSAFMPSETNNVVCTCVCVFVQACVHVHACMHACMYVCTYIHTYIHTSIHTHVRTYSHMRDPL